MPNEDAVKNSFQHLKKDIEQLKGSLINISKQIDSLEKTLPHKSLTKPQEKIFTSKVFMDDDIKESVSKVLDSGIFTLGSELENFERKFSEFCGIKHAIAVSNGTVAIEIVLKCLGIGKGDEVIVPSHTTMPTIEPILHLNATPVFVDIDEANYTLNVKEVEKVITKKTKAVLAVHLYGNSADLESLQKICEKNKIFLVEDCAQAHGTRYNGKHVGTFGVAGCFSFYPTKNLTVCGEGGMIITNSDEITKQAKMLRNHGEDGRYNHVILGDNHRLSEIHCAIGLKQLEKLEYFIERRRQIAQLYNSLLGNNKGVVLPVENKNAKHSYHLYVIRVDKEKRDKLIEKLKEINVFCGIHYPTPVHKQPVVTKFMKTPKLKVTEQIVKEIISLPMYPLLKDEEVRTIAEKINEEIK